MTHERQREHDTRQADPQPCDPQPCDPQLTVPVPPARDEADIAAAWARRARHDEYYVRLPRRRDGSA